MSDLVVSNVSDKAPNYSVTYSLRVTEDMDRRLSEILARQNRTVKRNDLLRAAIRQYLDDQEQVIGSRRNFHKSVQNHIDAHERTIIFYLNVILYMLAFSLAVILQAITKDSEVRADTLIREAVAETIKSGRSLNDRIQKVRERLESEAEG